MTTVYPHLETHSIIIKLLSKMFGLQENNVYGNDIDYFIYEMDWGKMAKEFIIEDKGKKWCLQTIGDLYDYLVYQSKKEK